MSTRKLVVLGSLLLLAACSKITQQNYAKLQVGMPRAEVESLLGAPQECSGAIGLSSCRWGDAQTGISVQFAADKVMLYSASGLK